MNKNKPTQVNPSYYDKPVTWVIRAKLNCVNLSNSRLRSWDQDNLIKKKTMKPKTNHTMSNDEVKKENTYNIKSNVDPH
jgi:hypothetical protein